MFEEVIDIDLIQVTTWGIICVREATVVKKDGKEISKTYKRWSLNPGEDVTSQIDRVRAVCEAIWTPEVIAAYQQHVAESERP